MVIVFIILFFAMLWCALHEHRKVSLVESELNYVSDKLKEIMRDGEFEYVMVPSDHKGVQKIAKEINHLLENYFSAQIKHRKSEKSLMQMMTNISHDLRTPLTVLSGYTEILKEKIKTKDTEDEVARLILKLSQKTNESVRMMTQFFEMTKLESGDVCFDIQKLNICSICGETIMEYYDILKIQGYEVEISIPERPIYIRADINACIRILKNLIDNVIKYGKDGRFLGIYIHQERESVIVRMEDHGKGIEEEEQELIFKRSYMQDKKGKQSFQSSGLGLSISRELAKHIGADLNVSSKPWEKTVFTIKFQKLENS